MNDEQRQELEARRLTIAFLLALFVLGVTAFKALWPA